MFKIGKMKVDNLVAFTILYLACIKRVGGFPNKVMVLVATLSIDVALT